MNTERINMKEERGKSCLETTIEQCQQMQKLIDISAQGVIKLRDMKIETESAALIEIQELEAKMIKNYALQLKAKQDIPESEMPRELRQYPQLTTWLNVVGFSESTAENLSKHFSYMDNLLRMEDADIRNVLIDFDCERHTNQLILALNKLRRYETSSPDSDLYWSSSPPSASLHRTISQQQPEWYSKQPTFYRTTPTTPSHSTPVSPSPSPSHWANRYKTAKNATPPPHKRLTIYPTDGSFPPPLHISRSYESQLAARVANHHLDTEANRSKNQKPSPNLSINGKIPITPRRRSAGDPEILQRMASEGQLPAPTSPKNMNVTPRRSMKHSITHMFQKKFFLGDNCDHCSRKMVALGKICKHCKKKFHSECAAKTPPRSCGLPDQYLDFFLETNSSMDSPSVPRRIGYSPTPNEAFQTSAETLSMASSCNSSSSSSPATFMPSASVPNTPSSTAQPSPRVHITSENGSVEAFSFPDQMILRSKGMDYRPSSPSTASTSSSSTTVSAVNEASTISVLNNSSHSNLTNSISENSNCIYENDDIINTCTSNDSDKSDVTLIDSVSDKASNIERFDSIESSEDTGQGLSRVNSISVALKEWDIPIEDLIWGDKIGEGRFGSVWKGKWHGEVAIKALDIDKELDEDEQLRAFKLEVSTLRKTRHDNLVLFQGACMKPPRLAIVMSYCKGDTLYKCIHESKSKVQMSKAIQFATQIIQGLGYLHAKQIVHKDLKSKNIFIVGNKIVISDFGLLSLTKLCNTYKNRRLGDASWLCYLAPELLRSLYVGRQQPKAPNMPFSFASDMFAFGTVWYELVCSEWPFNKQPAEAIIWQAGNGIKQPLTHVNASKDAKDLIMSCWKFEPSNRPNYDEVLEILKHLPKKRLARSPSHPVHLIRSAEAVF